MYESVDRLADEGFERNGGGAPRMKVGRLPAARSKERRSDIAEHKLKARAEKTDWYRGRELTRSLCFKHDDGDLSRLNVF